MLIHNINSDPNYDPVTLRVRYPIAFIESMPFKVITPEEIYELRCDDRFNPPDYYGTPQEEYPLGKILLKEGEIGHDESYRYVISG